MLFIVLTAVPLALCMKTKGVYGRSWIEKASETSSFSFVTIVNSLERIYSSYHGNIKVKFLCPYIIITCPDYTPRSCEMCVRMKSQECIMLWNLSC